MRSSRNDLPDRVAVLDRQLALDRGERSGDDLVVPRDRLAGGPGEVPGVGRQLVDVDAERVRAGHRRPRQIDRGGEPPVVGPGGPDRVGRAAEVVAPVVAPDLDLVVAEHVAAADGGDAVEREQEVAEELGDVEGAARRRQRELIGRHAVDHGCRDGDGPSEQVAGVAGLRWSVLVGDGAGVGHVGHDATSNRSRGDRFRATMAMCVPTDSSPS